MTNSRSKINGNTAAGNAAERRVDPRGIHERRTKIASENKLSKQELKQIKERLSQYPNLDQIGEALIEEIDAALEFAKHSQDFKSDFVFDSSQTSINGSRAWRVSLLLLALTSVFNSVGADSRVANHDFYQRASEFLQSVKQAAKDADKTISQVVDSALLIKPVAAQTIEILTQEEFLSFWNDCHQGNAGAVEEKLKKFKQHSNKLKTVLTTPSRPQQGYYPLYYAASFDMEEMAQKILTAAKNHPETFALVLTQTNENGSTALHRAANLGKRAVAKKILNAAKKNPQLLGEILTKKNKQSVSSFTDAIGQGRDDIVRDMLDAVKDYPEILVTILTQTDNSGLLPLYAAANLARNDIVVAI
jgi:hypothetical protein